MKIIKDHQSLLILTQLEILSELLFLVSFRMSSRHLESRDTALGAFQGPLHRVPILLVRRRREAKGLALFVSFLFNVLWRLHFRGGRKTYHDGRPREIKPFRGHVAIDGALGS